MKIALCDDNKATLDFIYNSVKNELDRRNIKASIVPYTNSKILLNAHAKNPFDVLFLDICMPGADGFDVAKEIRKNSKNTIIIFVTSKDELVYDSFEFMPFCFIRKDNIKSIKQNIEKVIDRLCRHLKQSKSITLKLDGRIKVVLLHDILYIKSDRHYVEYHLENEEVLRQRESMRELENRLENFDFIKVHQRYLINLKHIKFVDKKREFVLLENGERLEMSRNYKSETDKKFTAYLRDSV